MFKTAGITYVQDCWYNICSRLLVQHMFKTAGTTYVQDAQVIVTVIQVRANEKLSKNQNIYCQPDKVAIF